MRPLQRPRVSRARFLSPSLLVFVIALAAPPRAFAIEAPSAEIEASNKAPKAKLAVANVWTPLFTVLADGSASTDTDAWPIATYRFDFGDGSPLVDVAAPASAASHTY